MTNWQGTHQPLEMVIQAGQNAPLFNPVFIVRNWGRSFKSLRMNGYLLNAGKDFRHAIRRSLEGDDLIVWINMESDRLVTLMFE